jgi:hypothetical protein
MGKAVPFLLLLLSCGCGEAPRVISSSGTGAYEAALATFNDAVAVAWYDTRHGNADIFARFLDGDGLFAGDELRLTTGPDDSYEVSIDSVGTWLVVGFYDKAADKSLTPRLGLFGQDGRNLWIRTIATSGRNVVVRSDAKRIFAAWIQPEPDGSEAVWSGWWNVDGSERTPAARLAPASKTTWNLNAALDGDAALVVFDAVNGTKVNELFAVRVVADRAEFARLSADDGFESKYPDVAMIAGRVAMTWYDTRDGNAEVYLVTGSRDDFTREIDRRATRVTTTMGESIGAYLAVNGSRIGLAWSDATDGRHEIYFQPFDPNAKPLEEAKRLTDNETASLIPAIRPWKTGFVLAWNEFEPAVAASEGGQGHEGKSEIALVTVP